MIRREDWFYQDLYDDFCGVLWSCYQISLPDLQQELKTLEKDSDEYKEIIKKMDSVFIKYKKAFQLEIQLNIKRFETEEEELEAPPDLE